MTSIEVEQSDFLDTLRKLGGFYECPKDAAGRRLGPLVGYAARYDNEHQYVGDVYADCSRFEEQPAKLRPFAAQLAGNLSISEFGTIDVFCGAPEGGKTLAVLLALGCERRYVYPEKEITAKPANSREQTKLVWTRHKIKPGDRVAIVEDVMNNFSTTTELISLIEGSGGHATVIVGLLNRSRTVEGEFAPGGGLKPIRIHALVRKPIPEYQQDDPAVRADIERKNVVWKPKAEWARLMAAMNGRKK